MVEVPYMKKEWGEGRIFLYQRKNGCSPIPKERMRSKKEWGVGRMFLYQVKNGCSPILEERMGSSKNVFLPKKEWGDGRTLLQTYFQPTR